jgi:RNA polymerase sigma-70 factor (ECF subfamily)
LLYRLLGPDPEFEDVVHDTFVRALEALPKLQDPEALDAWVIGVAVRTARTRLQRKARRWWLRVVPAESMPESTTPGHNPEVSEAIGALYRVLNTMPVEQRVALVLRCAAKMTIAEAAHATQVSQSTLKRRLQKAEKAFTERAEREPALDSWLQRGEA